jgi:hypothetical protein
MTTVVGFLLGLLIHVIVETLFLRAGMAWDFWHPTYHLAVGLITAVGGIAFGIWIGFVWWDVVYVQRRHHGWFRK